jgi:hypothetical protein
MTSSAAPIFLPLQRGYADGGLVANNPVHIASHLVKPSMSKSGVTSRAGQLRILSITKTTQAPPPPERWRPVGEGRWGHNMWTSNLFEIIFIVNADMQDNLARSDAGSDETAFVTLAARSRSRQHRRHGRRGGFIT